MADSKTTSNGSTPFTRPAFLVAAVVVLVIALLGAIVAVRAARNNDTTPTPSTSITTEPVPSTPLSTPAGDGSVCGLPDGDQTELTTGPVATWKYQGTIAYPESPEQGPGKTAPEGYRYCFQHSPAGAVFMAANAIAQGSDPQIGTDWAQYALGEGPYRGELVGKIGTPVGPNGTRLTTVGFRVLGFAGTTARVDLAVRVTSQNQELLLSGVYELTWQDGDWKISADVQQPFDTATISDLSNYIPWGE